MARLVLHGARGGLHELGGRAQSQELQAEAREGGDGGVLHQALLREGGGESGVELGRKRRAARVAQRRAPIRTRSAAGEALGARGRPFVAEHFDRKALAARYLEILERAARVSARSAL